MNKQIRIVIADDHQMIREGLKQLLELDGDILVVGEAGNGEECLKVLEEVHPDVLLLDINMPVMNGLKMLEKLRHSSMRDQKVLILTIHNEIEYLLKAQEIGTNGYVLKDAESAVLKKAINTIYEGEFYIDVSMLPVLNQKKTQDSRGKEEEEKLTRREIEVLKLLAEGLFNKEIAYKLSISEKTVKNHVSNIFKKIGVFDRTQAAVYAIKNNIVDLY